MQFNSIYFILLFLPVTVLLYHRLLPKKREAADMFLIGMSLIFYTFAGMKSFLLLVILAAVNYALTVPMNRRTNGTEKAADTVSAGHGKMAKGLLGAGLILDIGVLLWLKYRGFFAENLALLLKRDVPFITIILPLGISFYIFSLITWLVDSYHGKTEDVSLTDYALFVTFFPKLTQGPILNIRRFLDSRHDLTWNYEKQAAAAVMFVLGMSKKILIADVFGKGVAWGFQYIDLTTTGDMILIVLAYTLQIYFDFSGYSDMAIALAMMFGYDFPANFNSPYKADSVTDFWKRWHISLTTFFREYVYFPLGGSRKGQVRTYINIMIVFLLSGLWHGANWTFVLWGALHGLCQILERVLGKAYQKIWKPIRWCVTFFIVNLLWLLFRCPDLHEFRRACWHLFEDGYSHLNEQHLEIYRIPGLRYVLSRLGLAYSDYHSFMFSAFLFFAFALGICLIPKNTQESKPVLNIRTLVGTLVLFTLCIFSLSSVSAFIYNNF